MATGDGRKSPANFARLQSNRVCDWTEHDCGVRLLLCVQRTVSAQLFRVAHSLGGLLFGGAPNGAELAGFVFVSTHTGYCGDYRRQNRIPMAIVRHAWIAAGDANRRLLPLLRFGWGEDMPAGITIGHFAFFRREADTLLWPRVTTYLNG
jgi:predicted alpha/beta hydrolase